MRLLTLEIKNIASLVEASVDFSSPELMSEPIFLVTGDTGSGKTSILNSICIALYNKVPALDAIEKDEDNHGVKIGSPLQLVRRNCSNAYIKLTFSDKEETVYTVDWLASRATRGPKKGEFNSSPIKRTLSILRKDGRQEHYSKHGEVSEQIEKALGLTFEQFCRTTMLAQGQFLKFIDSDKKNKSEILEKITGTEIYSQVGRRIHAITKEYRDRFNALDNQIAGAQLLSDEEKRQLAEQVAVLDKQIEDKTKGFAEIEAHEKWLEDDALAKADLEKAKDELAVAASEDKKQAVEKLRSLLKDWEETADIRRIIFDGAKANQDFTAKNEEVSAHRPKFEALAKGLAWLAKSIDDCRQQIAENGSAIEAEKQYAPVYAAEGQALTLIGVIEGEENNIKQEELKIKQLRAGLSTVKSSLDRERDAVEALQKQLDERQAEVDRITKEGEGIDAKDLNQKKDAAANRLDKANNAITVQKAYAESEANHANKLAEIAEVEKQLAKDKDACDAAIENKEKLKADSDAAAQRLRGQMDLSERLAELTHIFKDTHSCPLCGSDVEHLHTKDFIDQALSEARKEAGEAQKAYEAATEAANSLVVAVKARETNLKNAIAEAERLQKLTDERHAAFEAFGIPSDELQTQYDQAKAQLDSLSEALQRALDHAAALKTATLKRDSRSKAVEAAKSTLDKIESKVKDIEVKINEANASVASLAQEKQANIGKLNELLAKAPHPELDVKDLAAIKEKLPRLKANYDSLIDRAGELARKLEDLRNTRQEADEKLALVESSFGRPDPMAEPRECRDIAKEAGRLSTDVISLRGQIEEIDRRRKDLAKQEEEYFAEHPKDETLSAIERVGEATADTIAAKRKQADEYDLAVANLKGKIEHLTGRVAELANKRPASLPDELTLRQVRSDKDAVKAEIDLMIQRNARDKGRLEQNEAREKDLAKKQEELNRVKEEYGKWEKLNKLLGNESGDKFRTLAQAYIFGLLLRSANRFMEQLTDRYTLEGEVGSLVIYVIDHHDGNNKRVAKGLSGGEGFMASLSLALALSTIDQNLDPLDILFIDEGFGALDPTAREFTIDMLCSLQRRVCVISHMPELRECIPTQIIVKRQTGTSRSTLTIKTNQ